MRKTILTLLVAGMAAQAGVARAETQQQKQHEAACIAGTVTGAILGAAVGGFFGNGAGKTLMQVATGGGGALLGHNLACKKS